MAHKVVVVGGANIDIVAAPYAALKEHDSNPGHSSISFGGVGRNIAENLSRLGCQVQFISVFGDDSFSRTLMQDLTDKGIDLSLCKTIRGQTCSKYICINSEKGELIAAINDMSLYDHMYAAITDEALAAMNSAELVVLDANTSQELLEKIAAACTTPIAFDAVSISKVARCANILDKLFIFKPNLYEAAALYDALNGRDVALNNPDDPLNVRVDPDYTPSDKTGSDPDSDGIAADKTGSDGDPPDSSARHPADLSSRVRCQVCRYAAFLRSRGVKNVMISLGKDGVYYENEDCSGIMPSMVRDIANTSGCGDAFLAGAVRGYLDNGSLEAMARYGSAASAICAAHDETVSPELDMTKINEILKEHEHPV